MTILKTFPEDAGGTWWIGLSQEEHQAASNRIRAARLAAGEEDLGDDYYDRSKPIQKELTEDEQRSIETFFKHTGLKTGEISEADLELTYPKLK
jgi:hypothetical protein